MTGTFDPLLAAESLVPPRTGIGNYTWNLYRELLPRPEIGRVVLMAGLGRIDQAPDRIAASSTANAASRPLEALGSVLARYGLAAGEYLLTVGTIEPRKNPCRPLAAYAGLPATNQAGAPLVVVGASGWRNAAELSDMASGVPVLCSAGTSMEEVTAGCARLADPFDEDAIRDGLLALIEDEDSNRGLTERGFRRAAALTWAARAEGTVRLYRTALSGGHA